MSKGLINSLTYIYRFINLGRGVLTKDELNIMGQNAHIMSTRAKDIINVGTPEEISQDTAMDLNQAVMIEQHIAESIDWQLRQEII